MGDVEGGPPGLQLLGLKGEGLEGVEEFEAVFFFFFFFFFREALTDSYEGGHEVGGPQGHTVYLLAGGGELAEVARELAIDGPEEGSLTGQEAKGEVSVGEFTA